MTAEKTLRSRRSTLIISVHRLIRAHRAYYGGNANDYITVWKFMYARVKAALPTVQFMWCANVCLRSIYSCSSGSYPAVAMV